MKKILVSLFFLVFVSLLKAQTPQFAVVRPDGNTSVHSSWEAAYNNALDGDALYLPGVVISSTILLDKRLFIYGAGHHPDSSIVTGRTIFSGNLLISKGASGGSIEGIQINFPTNFYNGLKTNGFLIKRCLLEGLSFSQTSSPVYDSLPENITVTECVIRGPGPSINGHGSKNNVFSKNIVTFTVVNFMTSDFRNNLFLRSAQPFSTTFSGITNSVFENNIFIDPNPLSYTAGNCGNSFTKNLKLEHASFSGSQSCPTLLENGNMMTASINDIFVNTPNNGFDYAYDYHLKPTCIGAGAGTDGTDLGIYGTSQPTSEGWVPSNPHIYFKQVAPQTNSNGQLQIEFRVRTNN